ncbi:MAG: DUF4132 domain-containing protein [Deltaproteobacteria bacterium]|nr:DUF4132 domain-containing protein [Deltaproteobacteria bacterium]
MADVTALIDSCRQYRTAEAALAKLALLPLEQKRAQVHPALIALAKHYFCDEAPPHAHGFELVELAAFLMSELATTPELAAQLYAAIGSGRVKHRADVFCRFAAHARDRRALPLLRDLWHHLEWVETVLALEGVELLDVIEHALERRHGDELAIAAGYLGGERMRATLLRHYGDGITGADRYALGIAFLANRGDAAWFERVTGGTVAKRIYTGLTSTRPKERLAIVDKLGKDIGLARASISPARLLALVRILLDPDLVIVERAAGFLLDYSRGHRDRATCLFHMTFLDHAAKAVAAGVTARAREHLDALVARIPRAAPLPPGELRTPPPPRPSAKAVAKQRAEVMLEDLRGTLGEPLAAGPAAVGNPELEALLVEDPTDIGRYLVYADWLQTAGDPRGALLALDHAAHQTRDQAHVVAANALRYEHHQAFLGPLEPFTRERDGLVPVQLEWFMGFIKAARLRLATDDLVETVLGYLFDSPSGRVLQELVVEPPSTRRVPDADRIVKVLLARRPPTLAMLQIGKPGSWQITPELRAAFPRLLRDPGAEWADVMARVAEQRRLKVELDPVELPALEPRVSGITVDPEAVLVGLKAELDKLRPLGLLAAMPRMFSAESLDRFALALAHGWQARGENPRWPFDALGPLGGDRCVGFLAAHLTTWSHQRAVQGFDHLARIGSDLAVHALVEVALAPRSVGARRYAALEVLDRIAQTRGLVDRAQLLDRTCPSPSIEAPAGRSRVIETQRGWLLSIMLSGHRIALGDFRQHVAHHPLRQPLASTLLWAECVGPRIVGLFRVAGNGALVRANGEPYEIKQAGAEGHGIGLVHPAELDVEDLERARELFTGSDQAIIQLERPIFTLTDDERRKSTLVRFAKRRVGFYAIEAALEQRGWTAAFQDDGGGTTAFSRFFERDEVLVVARLGTSQGSIGEVEVWPRGSHVDRCRFDRLHAVTCSELLWDLETAHGRPADAPRTAPSITRDVPPIVERAKTGRSKCVVCTNAIDKGALRIGVERLIETPAFTGLGTVWAHPGCRAGVPELANVRGLDELLAAG